MRLFAFLQSSLLIAAASIAGYVVFVAILAIPAVQNQAIYLNRVSMTWFQDVNAPENRGLLHNQATPFMICTPDGNSLHAWHILPLQTYLKHEEALIQEPAGLVHEVTQRLSFKLLRDDPSSLLVLYFHGAAGTLGSGYRPPSYMALYAGAPDRIHTVAIDYRGFGASTGAPSEEGLLTDALALVDWATNVAKIPPSRIVVFAQSLGTGVALSLSRHLSTLSNPILFSGTVLVAPFVNVEHLTASYRLAGTTPLLGPVAHFPKLLSLLNKFILSKWPSKDNIAKFIRQCEDMTGEKLYHIHILHAEDDYDIPWTHSEELYWHAVNASLPLGISKEQLEDNKQTQKVDLGAGGWVARHETTKGIVVEQILKYGLHDRIMGYPAVSSAVLQAFRKRDIL